MARPPILIIYLMGLAVASVLASASGLGCWLVVAYSASSSGLISFLLLLVGSS